MPKDTNEASGQVIIRTVPLLYGFVCGDLFDEPMKGFEIGSVISVGLNLMMHEKSIFLPFFVPLVSTGCPPVTAILSTLSLFVDSTTGMRVPKYLTDIRCPP